MTIIVRVFIRVINKINVDYNCSKSSFAVHVHNTTL